MVKNAESTKETARKETTRKKQTRTRVQMSHEGKKPERYTPTVMSCFFFCCAVA